MSAGPLLAAVEPSAHADVLRAADALAGVPGAGCLLGPDGEILFVNDGWDRFALRNGGAPGALGARLLGKRYGTFIEGLEARAFFDGVWLQVLCGQPVAYRAACDSAEVARAVASSFSPVRLGTRYGALVTHLVLSETPRHAAGVAGLAVAQVSK